MIRPHGPLDGGMPAPGMFALCVLSSSSSGNCSLVAWHDRGRRRVAMIDCGLSPRKTARLMGEVGIGVEEVSDLLLTHLDSDHAHPGWWRRPPREFAATVRMDRRQMGRAERSGMLVGRRTEPFSAGEGFEIAQGCAVGTVALSHDDLGVTAFRFATDRCTLGFATDLGRVTSELTEQLREVDVLAIESNYCPRMQIESDRPEFLKRRIMDGAGHLSNQEAALAVREIAPRDHAVFLHLSRQCNSPGLVLSEHAGSDYAITVAEPDRPTRWVLTTGDRGAKRRPAPIRVEQRSLFADVGGGPA
ncbi:MAG: MBL fold metallo-hydrolase [Planctomycetota bacterium]